MVLCRASGADKTPAHRSAQGYGRCPRPPVTAATASGQKGLEREALVVSPLSLGTAASARGRMWIPSASACTGWLQPFAHVCLREGSYDGHERAEDLSSPEDKCMNIPPLAHAHTRMQVHICTHTHTHTCRNTHTKTHTHTRRCTFIHTHTIHKHMHTHTHTHTHTHKLHIHIHTRTHTHKHTHYLPFQFHGSSVRFAPEPTTSAIRSGQMWQMLKSVTSHVCARFL